MTLSATTTYVEYTGNDVTVDFDFTFPMLDIAHLVVTLEVIATGTVTTLTASQYDIDYTTANGRITNGTVTYPKAASPDDPLSSTHRIKLARVVPLTQEVEIKNQGGFQPTVLEKMLDRATMQIQQLNSAVLAKGSAFTYSGEGIPDSELGEDGNTYLNLENGDVFSKSGETWNVVGSVQGPQGVEGPPGEQGPTGPIGLELLSNVNLAGPDGLTLGSGWTHADGKITKSTPGTSTRVFFAVDPPLVAGKTYVIKLVVSGATALGVSVRLAGTYTNLSAPVSNGTHYFLMVCPPGFSEFGVISSPGFDGSVEEWSCMELATKTEMALQRLADNSPAGDTRQVERCVLAKPTSQNFYPLNANMEGVGQGVVFRDGARFSSIVFNLAALAGVTELTFSVWRRPLPQGDVSGTMENGGGGAYDVRLYQKTYTLEELGVAKNVGTSPIRFAADSGEWDRRTSSEYIYLFEVIADGPLLTEQCAQPIAVEPDWYRGYRINITPDAIEDNTFSIACHVYAEETERVRVPDSKTVTVAANDEEFVAASGTFAAGSNITVPIPSVAIRRPGNDDIVTVAGNVLMVAPSSTAVVDEAHSFTDGSRVLLSAAGVDNVSVTAGGSPLVEGTDYIVEEGTGVILALSTHASVLVSYNKRPPRYYLVSASTESGAGKAPGSLMLTAGTARDLDPNNGMPSRPDNSIPLFSAYVQHDRVSMVPVHRFRDGIRVDEYLEFQAWRSEMRRRLQNVLRAAHSGAAIKNIGDGDSITALGGAASRATPNGDRDQLSYFTRSSAWISANVTGYSGADALGRTGTHYRLGWNWFIRDALRAIAGSSVTYDNHGVGSTSAAMALADTTGTAAITSSITSAISGGGAALVVVAFGTNAGSDIQANVNATRGLVQAYKSAGADVLVVGPPAFNDLSYLSNHTSWMESNNALWQMSDEEEAAFVPTFWVAGRKFRGATGISGRALSSENGYNHPGPPELAAIGRLAASLFWHV